MKNKISENSKIKNILEIKGAEKILAKYNFPCLSCPMAAFEIERLELGKVCQMYGLNIKNILKELNLIR